MFFKKISEKRAASKSLPVKAAQEIETSREEMKRRLAQIEMVNLSLCEASRQTQVASIDAAEKFDRMMKIPKKSLRAISSKLHEGLVLINCDGEIIHVNREGTKILGISENEVIGKKMGDLVTCANPFYDSKGNLIEKPILRSEFFPELSKKIFEKLSAPTMEVRGKYLVCNDMLREELPFCFDHELDRVLGVSVACGDKKIENMMVTFTVIDNEPDSVTDITYLFLFSTA